MGFNCGIIGLPNVGKSTLFNALTATIAADAQNYPFCTIEPNLGKALVPDEMLAKLAEFEKSQKVIPTQLEIVDIAGLVKGASAGEGLGNKFLGHIQAVDAILHVVRCFENDDIVHVNGKIDPLGDIDIINTELALADLESLDKQMKNLEKKTHAGDKEAIANLAMAAKIKKKLEAGESITGESPQFNLLSSKPVIYICNVDEKSAGNGNNFSRLVYEKYAKTPDGGQPPAKVHSGASVLSISSKIEMEIAQIRDISERKMFLDDLGLSESGLSQIIRTGYATLGLLTFYTVGPKEAHAWTIQNGMTAPEAAGKIHTDFEKGFIRAEIYRPEDWLSLGGELAVKNAGKCKTVGRDYAMQNGDIANFLFSK
ncbi:MAG: redox-regulated ATPase YchF [Rickettsiales bacterium]|jgi:GTP-binding protein YchF|nr:redox-regulated ATPase YchF [Rickettsiales bacterium]